MRSEKVDVAFGTEGEIGADKVDVRRLNSALSRGETHAGAAEIERERLGTNEIYGATMANDRRPADCTRDRYKRECAVCCKIHGAARDIRKFGGVEGHVPANRINRYVVRGNDAAPIQEIVLRKSVKVSG